MPVSIRARMPRLNRLPEDSWEGERLLGEVRDLYQLLKDTEARHVSRALSDGRFLGRRFPLAQQELAALRGQFAERVRALIPHFGEAAQRELLTMAILAEQAPLTSPVDVEAIRSSRSRSA